MRQVPPADGRAAPARVGEVDADLWIPDDRAWGGASGAPALAAAPVPHVGEPVAISPLYLVTGADGRCGRRERRLERPDSEDAVRLAAAPTPVGVDVRRAAGPDQVRAAFLHAVAGAAGG